MVDTRNEFEWLIGQDSAPQQLALASCVVLNQYTRSDADIDTLRTDILSLNPVADVRVLSLRDDKPMPIDLFFGAVGYQTRGNEDNAALHDHAHETHGFNTHKIRWNESVDESLFSAALEAWIESSDLDLLRPKGSVRTDDSGKYIVVQGVRKQVTIMMTRTGLKVVRWSSSGGT